MTHSRHKREPSPLDREELERLALAYVGRYATTRAKLRLYLNRKLRERGWEAVEDPPVEILVERMAELGFIDETAFALSRAASFQRRGFGERRLGPALRAAGIGEKEAAQAHEIAADQAWASALRFAERKRIGPFAPKIPDRPTKMKQFAMMMRAGHRPDIIRRLLDSILGDIPDGDDL